MLTSRACRRAWESGGDIYEQSKDKCCRFYFHTALTSGGLSYSFSHVSHISKVVENIYDAHMYALTCFIISS